MVDISNKNFLSPLNFKFQLKRAPHINFFIQTINIPSLSLPSINVSNPLVRVPFPGDHLVYEDLQISFRVDEDLQDYMEIHNWLRSLGKLNYTEYQSLTSNASYTGQGIRSDISLTILTSQKVPNYEIIFKDAFPTNISSLNFTTMDEQLTYIEASATFKFVYFDINEISG